MSPQSPDRHSSELPGPEVRIDALQRCLEECLRALRCPPPHAAHIAEVLVDGDLRGYPDHGTFLVGLLTEWIRKGVVSPTPAPSVVRETPTSVLLDGDRGCGVIPATEAMARATAKAKEVGIACAGVINAGHFVAAAPYLEMAARSGLIAFVCANGNPRMPPTGGRTRTFGTNPLGFAFPAREHDPVVFDMATSAIAAAKIRAAALRGTPLAEGLILDADGNPTVDARAFLEGGMVLPLGGAEAGHKGYGLAMAVDALAGVLLGTGFARTAGAAQSGEGKFFLAIDPALFLGDDGFAQRMDEQIRQAKTARTLPGVTEVVVPGERSARRRRAALERGTVTLAAPSWQTLVDTCGSLSVAAPAALTPDAAAWP